MGSPKTFGNKVNNVDIVYTPWQNLKKTASMDVGQVGFQNQKMVHTVTVEKLINEIVSQLNMTKVERTPDLKAEREAVNAVERAEKKQHLREKVACLDEWASIETECTSSLSCAIQDLHASTLLVPITGGARVSQHLDRDLVRTCMSF